MSTESTTTIDAIKKDILKFARNPALIQRPIIDILSEIQDGTIKLVDASSPVVYTIEAAAVLVSSFLDEDEALTRALYPALAKTTDEIYLHMSDKDYIDRFAIASNGKFIIMMGYNELINSLVFDSNLGINKITIPRNTVFKVADTQFSLQYPINIKQMAHGGLQITYDTTIQTGLQNLSSNALEWKILKDNLGNQWLIFTVDAQQFFITTKNISLTSSAQNAVTISYVDSYYHCRVYHQNADGTWTEIKTTHTDQVYDPNTPTAVLKVDSVAKTLNVIIPQVYTVSGKLSRTIRVDVYQTKGVLDMVLENYAITDFTVNWLAIDSNDSDKFTAPLSSFKQIAVYSIDTVSGGSNEKDFNTLKNQVIDNSIGAIEPPITPDQVETYIQKNGYKIIKNIDVVTNRTFIATKPLPIPTDKFINTSIPSTVGTLVERMDKMSGLSGVIDNGNRITVCSNAVFLYLNGLYTHVTKDAVNKILAMSSESRALAINGSKYFYTPFHYVLDATQDTFDFRAYYMDAPKINSKTFVLENDTTLLDVKTGEYTITKNDSSYVLTLLTASSDEFKALDDVDIQVQLAYTPPGETTRAYMLGTLVGKDPTSKERYYQFNLTTDFDITGDDDLILNSFNMYNLTSKSLGIQLTNDVEIFYTTNSDVGTQWVTSSIDEKLGHFQLLPAAKAISYEMINLSFGTALGSLWKRARTTITSIDYKTYPADVLAFYEVDQYAINPTTNSIFYVMNGELHYSQTAKKGDPIYDASGNQVVLHHAGDYVLDTNGKPIITSQRALARQLEIFMLDGAFRFATTSTANTYKTTIANTLENWISNDLSGISKVLLDKTNIYYYPEIGAGEISVLINDGKTTAINANQALVVSLGVSEAVFKDDVIRERLTTSTIATIVSGLDSSRIAISDLISALKPVYGTDVLSINISGLGGDLNLEVATIINDSDKLTIGKKLVALANNELAVEEDIAVNFFKHALG